MAKIVRRKKKQTTIRVQVHARFPVPPGYVLHPDLVTELVDDWIAGDTPDAGDFRMVDWEIKDGNRIRTGKITKKEGELDKTGDIRVGLIQRFQSGGFRASFPNVGKNQIVIGIDEEYDESDFDDEEF